MNPNNYNQINNSDDEKECTFTPHINKNFKGYNNNINDNIESHVYYSPAFNISSKFPINRDQNNQLQNDLKVKNDEIKKKQNEYNEINRKLIELIEKKQEF